MAQRQREKNVKKKEEREKVEERHEDSKKGKRIESEIKRNYIFIDINSRLSVQ